MIPHHCVPLILETELIHVRYPYVVEGVVQIDHLVPVSGEIPIQEWETTRPGAKPPPAQHPLDYIQEQVNLQKQAQAMTFIYNICNKLILP
jgi:hypothetical protein